jgi:hypothetical protein
MNKAVRSKAMGTGGTVREAAANRLTRIWELRKQVSTRLRRIPRDNGTTSVRTAQEPETRQRMGRRGNRG